MSSSRFPELWQFLGGYFHEDFDTYAPTWEGIVDFYAAETTQERRAQAVFELNMLLAEEPDDPSLERVLDELTVAFTPRPLGEREWLVAVRDRVAATL